LAQVGSLKIAEKNQKKSVSRKKNDIILMPPEDFFVALLASSVRPSEALGLHEEPNPDL
jgi:hypothetical protein